MKKLHLAAAAGSASAALIVGAGIGAGHADPGINTLNVVGEPYAKAVAILRAQGVKAVFGGSVGSDLPQAQCVVKSQKVLSASMKMQLALDCTAAANPDLPATGTSGTQGAQDASGTSGTSGAPATQTARPTPGAPGVVTVVPTAVG